MSGLDSAGLHPDRARGMDPAALERWQRNRDWYDWFDGDDEVMDRCRLRAWDFYGDGGTLHHERVAWELGKFLHARISEQPPSPQREALLSVVRLETRTATYFSCGRKAIIGALYVLLRLAEPYREHPDYQPEWTPGQQWVPTPATPIPPEVSQVEGCHCKRSHSRSHEASCPVNALDRDEYDRRHVDAASRVQRYLEELNAAAGPPVGGS